MALLRMLGDRIDALIGDKGYDSDAIRDELATIDVKAVIPSKSTRRHPAPLDRDLYKQRNLIERMFNKLKNWRRIATRYDNRRREWARNPQGDPRRRARSSRGWSIDHPCSPARERSMIGGTRQRPADFPPCQTGGPQRWTLSAPEPSGPSW
jgi:transposase